MWWILTDSFEKVEVTSRKELRSWLENYHDKKETVRLVTYKKSEWEKYVDRWSVLDELLCFWWIDGIRRKLDEKRTMQLIAPRKVHYRSKTYKDRIVILTEQWLMTKAWNACVQKSKDNWTRHFYDDVDALIIPADFETSLNSVRWAKEYFDSLPASAKRYTLRHIKLAKTQKTRNKRIDEATYCASQGKCISWVRMV